jgi:hypothetical protein
MLPAGFEPIIPASERSQTHTLDRAATGIGPSINYPNNVVKNIQVMKLGIVFLHVSSLKLQIFSFMSQLPPKRTPTTNMTWFMHVHMRRDGKLHILAISAILADNQSADTRTDRSAHS